MTTEHVDEALELDDARPPDGWEPRLNPTQKKVFNSCAKYCLAAGEKGSGKTAGCLAAIIRHCYEEDEALALVIAPQIRTGKEGVMYDLSWMLDIWKHGNLDPKDPSKRTDNGIGLEYTEASLDPQTKDRMLYIKNRFGSWSKIILMSIPYAEVVEKRMKGVSPSFVYVDEITELDSREFFTYVAQQLGRRRGIRGPQQYFASCNPEGPSHWVYHVWFQDCIDAETGERDKDYEVHHVPVTENYYNLPPGYVEMLQKLYRDPTDRARLIEGRWVDRPSGEAIFREYFKPDVHVRGRIGGKLLTPKKGGLHALSYDPGPRNYCVTFLQLLQNLKTSDGVKSIWIAYDELNFVNELMRDEVIVNRILEKMDYWQGWCQATHKEIITPMHVVPEEAFSHRRHDGSYDATRLKQLSKGRISPRECPQAAESVPQRVQLIMNLFLTDCLFISANCVRTIEMLRLLVSEKVKEGKYDRYRGLKPLRSPYLHPFDALSYAPYKIALQPALVGLQTQKTEGSSSVFRAGSG